MPVEGMFNQIEDMPYKAFREGVEWNWETFEEYVNRIKTRPDAGAYPDEQAYRLWTLILTEIWARTFMDGGGERPLPPIL